MEVGGWWIAVVLKMRDDQGGTDGAHLETEPESLASACASKKLIDKHMV
jgi:hypothetical protein